MIFRCCICISNFNSVENIINNKRKTRYHYNVNIFGIYNFSLELSMQYGQNIFLMYFNWGDRLRNLIFFFGGKFFLFILRECENEIKYGNRHQIERRLLVIHKGVFNTVVCLHPILLKPYFHFRSNITAIWLKYIKVAITSSFKFSYSVGVSPNRLRKILKATLPIFFWLLNKIWLIIVNFSLKCFH